MGVVIVGSLNVDHVVRVAALPQQGETVAGSDYRVVAGGKGLNQAVSAARQGAAVAMIAAVGDDAGGESLLSVLDTEGIDGGGLRRVVGTPTGVALITVADQGDNTVVVVAGANGSLSPADVTTERMAGAAVVLTQLEIPLPAVRAALEAGRAAGAITLLNPAPAAGPLADELLALVDVLVPNETEARALTGITDPSQAALELAGKVPGAVLVTLGERGARLVRAGDDPVELPPFRVHAVDTTAAGDAFCGTLAAALAAGDQLEDAARRASAAGALAATRMGAVPSLPAAAEVDRLVAG